MHLPSHRPISPVEEDLQKLFDEVLAGFADEETPERDLEIIYNGYTDECTNDNNHLLQFPLPGLSHGLLRSLCKTHDFAAPRTPSPYQPPIDTINIPPTSSIQSPTRRRLPPTPKSLVPTTMPEPEPYSPSNMPPQKLYSSYQPFPLQDGSSPHSSKRRLPQEPGYFNGSNFSNKVQTPTQDPPTPSSSSYTSHPNSSYSTISTTVTFDGTTKSPVSVATMPPTSATVYTNEFDPYTKTYRPSYNPYDEEIDEFNHLQPPPTEDFYSEAPEPTPVPPPLPPKILYLSRSSSLNPPDDSTPLPPREYTCHHYEYELTTEPQSRMYHLPKRHNSRNLFTHLLQKWILMHSSVMCLQMILLLQPTWKTGTNTPTCMVIAKANLTQKTMDPLPLLVLYINQRTCYRK